MGFSKVVKNKAYFKRFQVQFRRRREGKTDYAARRALVIQDKTKYNIQKVRFVVRTTNTDIVCQFVRTTVAGDRVLSAAYSHELPRYGMPVGLTSYGAAYATGLLAGRRLMQQFKLSQIYKGNSKIGDDFMVTPKDGEHRPVYAFLDVGLRRTTVGAGVFAAMKGAVDAGIEIPHSASRWVGYDEKEKNLDSHALRKRILNGHIADYMKKLEQEDNAKYQRHFSQYIKNNIKPAELESLWLKVHKAIRTDPAAVKSTKPKPTKHKQVNYQKRRTLEERKKAVQKKLAALANK